VNTSRLLFESIKVKIVCCKLLVCGEAEKHQIANASPFNRTPGADAMEIEMKYQPCAPPCTKNLNLSELDQLERF
jgi:hypothetical protein